MRRSTRKRSRPDVSSDTGASVETPSRVNSSRVAKRSKTTSVAASTTKKNVARKRQRENPDDTTIKKSTRKRVNRTVLQETTNQNQNQTVEMPTTVTRTRVTRQVPVTEPAIPRSRRRNQETGSNELPPPPPLLDFSTPIQVLMDPADARPNVELNSTDFERLDLAQLDSPSPVAEQQEQTVDNDGRTQQTDRKWIVIFIVLPCVAIVLAMTSPLWMNATLARDGINQCSDIRGYGHYCGNQVMQVENRVRGMVRAQWRSKQTVKVEQQIGTLESRLFDLKKRLGNLDTQYAAYLQTQKQTSTVDIEFVRKYALQHFGVEIDFPKAEEDVEEDFLSLEDLDNMLKPLLKKMRTVELQLNESATTTPPQIIRNNHNNNTNGITRKEFVSSIEDTLEMFSADKMGMRDLSLPHAKLFIVREKTSPTFMIQCPNSLPSVTHLVCELLFGKTTKGPETLFQSTEPSRPCWTFNGAEGNVTILFDKKEHVRGFALEQQLSQLLPIHDEGTTPKQMIMFGLDWDSYTEVPLAEIKYDRFGPSIQYAYSKSETRERFDGIRINFVSNYGSTYTCVHRLRVL